MNGKQLKNSILQLAIQGKLVPQDPNDEPASVLLQRIRKEKEDLVKSGQLKKKDLVSEPITDDEKPFEIPESWELCRIGDIFFTSSGCTPLSSNHSYYGGDINWTRTTDLNNGYLYNCEKTITKKAFDECNLKIIPRDSLCLAMYGGAGTIGKYSLIKFDTTINQSVCAIYPNKFCSMEYLYYFMQYQRPFWMDFAAGSRKDPNINKIIINHCAFPLPPLAEQRRIVEKIEQLMPLAEEYGSAQEKLDKLNADLPEALRKSILQQAISGKLVPQDPNDEPASVLLQRIRKEKESLVKSGKLKKKDLVTTPITDDEKPFDIPESWEWCRLGDIFEHNNGKQLNRADTNGEYHDYITTSNLYWDYFDLTEVRQMLFTDDELLRCTATKGDLLVCEGGDVGRSAIWDKDYDICIQNHIHRLRAYYPLCTRYFLYLMMLNKSLGLIGGKGIGIQGLSAKALHNILVALPPLSEQRRIVAKIEELFSTLK